MIWTKEKPTIPGYYWLKMTDTPFSQQAPRVVLVGPHPEEAEDELWSLEGPDYDDGFLVADMAENFDWSSDPISLPVVAGSCGCANVSGGVQACSACAR